MICSTAGGRVSLTGAAMLWSRSIRCRNTSMSAPDTTPAAARPSGACPQILARPDGATIAYHLLAGACPGIVFLGGYRSDMTGTKALFLEDYCRPHGLAYGRLAIFVHV